MKKIILLAIVSVFLYGSATHAKEKNKTCDVEKLRGYYKDPSIIRGVDGKRTFEEVSLVIGCNAGKIYKTYKRYLEINPNLEGKIVIDFTVLSEGDVERVKIVDSMIENEKFLIEVMSIIYKIKFAKGRVEPLTVTYPIELFN
jgi:hypothetical protein